MQKRYSFLLLFILLISYASVLCQIQKTVKHENVIYGTISGLSLLMDVYQPSNSNNLGIIYMAGNGWGYFDQRDYNQGGLKESFFDTAYNGKWVNALLQKGYTVFMVNHRFAPQFHFSDIFSDCQRAVRFIRYHAKTYKINPNHIGAMGHSSGANLSSMLGVTDTNIIKFETPVDSVSSKVQAVVSLAAPFNLADFNKKEDTALTRDLALKISFNYVGVMPDEKQNEFTLSGKYAEASPISYVTKGDAPFLIYYSDDDFIVPQRQPQTMHQTLKQSSVPAKIVMTHNQLHWPRPDMEEVDRWFKQYLK